MFVVADAADTTVTLHHVSVSATSAAPIQTYSFGGFTAQTVSTGPDR